MSALHKPNNSTDLKILMRSTILIDRLLTNAVMVGKWMRMCDIDSLLAILRQLNVSMVWWSAAASWGKIEIDSWFLTISDFVLAHKNDLATLARWKMFYTYISEWIYLFSQWGASSRPHAFQVQMMHQVGKNAICTWAWALAFTQWSVRNIKAAV